jgi:ATP phosphoribosyltransferase
MSKQDAIKAKILARLEELLRLDVPREELIEVLESIETATGLLKTQLRKKGAKELGNIMTRKEVAEMIQHLKTKGHA